MSSPPRLSVACLAFGLAVVAGATRAGTDEIFANGFEPPPPPTFVVSTPTATIAPGEEVSYCFFFRTPNAATVGIRRLESTLSPAATSLFVYATYSSGGVPTELQPPGTFTTADCGAGAGGGSGTLSKRIYQTQRSFDALQMPANDGTGVPLAIELLASQPLYIELHFLNATASPITGSADLSAFALATGVYTRTAAYMTYNGNISVPAMSIATVSANCAVPPSTRFWWFSTQTHRFATNATLRSGSQTLVVTTDWQNPAVAQFGPPTFYQFASGERLTYECTYNNTLTQTITTGDSWATDENCVGLAYFFPATTPLLCFNNFGPF
jgi:hypothetical protein